MLVRIILCLFIPACYLSLISFLALSPSKTVDAATPYDLSNFQDEYACDNKTVLIVRPKNVEDIIKAVKLYKKIQAVGEGHSWNEPFFCASPFNNTSANSSSGHPGSSSVNIVTTTIRPLKINVDEHALAVDVDAGVKTIDLLNFLGNYVTAMSPTGYTLPAFPWFVYQSIGGAVATGTHGSSLTYGSLSNQLLSITMVLANGTVRTFSEANDPFLMRAVRVSVGQLGVITNVRLRIVKEQPVKRTLRILTSTRFLSLLAAAENQWNTRRTLPRWANETEFFWITQRSEFMMVSFTRADISNSTTRHDVLSMFKNQEPTSIYNVSQVLNKSITEMDQLPLVKDVRFGLDGLAPLSHIFIENITAHINEPFPNYPSSAVDNQSSCKDTSIQVLKQDTILESFDSNCSDESYLGSTWVVPKQKPPSTFYVSSQMASLYLDISRAGVLSIANNATVEAHLSYLYQPAALVSNIRTVLYDQYEVAIPVGTMARCFKGLLDLAYNNDIDSLNKTERVKDKGFRTAPLIRFVSKEDGLLSYTGDTPRIFINIEDYIFYNSGNKINTRFKALVGYLRSSEACGGSGGPQNTGGRLHWGKAGWPDKGCWHGDKEYPDTWCDFGCAKLELDPEGKFADNAPDRWNFDGVDLKNCCGPNGFMIQKKDCKCSVQHKRQLVDCPPSPWYSNR